MAISSNAKWSRPRHLVSHVRKEHWLIDQNGSNTSVLRVPVQELAERRRVNTESSRLASMTKLCHFDIHDARGSMYLYHSHGP